MFALAFMWETCGRRVENMSPPGCKNIFFQNLTARPPAYLTFPRHGESIKFLLLFMPQAFVLVEVFFHRNFPNPISQILVREKIRKQEGGYVIRFMQQRRREKLFSSLPPIFPYGSSRRFPLLFQRKKRSRKEKTFCSSAENEREKAGSVGKNRPVEKRKGRVKYDVFLSV